MDGNLEVGVFEVNGEHPVVLPDQPKPRLHCLHLELGHSNEATEGGQIDDQSTPRCLLHKEEAAVKAQIRLIDRLQSPFWNILDTSSLSASARTDHGAHDGNS